MQKDPFRRIKIDLLKFTHQKDSDNIKLLLESYPREIKGSIFEWYLAELYRGTGWLTEIRGGRADAGADILLYHPKTPLSVSLIVQAKNQTYDSLYHKNISDQTEQMQSLQVLGLSKFHIMLFVGSIYAQTHLSKKQNRIDHL